MEFNANFIRVALLVSVLYSFTCTDMQDNRRRKTAIVLSGCGYLDGTNVIEAVSVSIALSEMGKTLEYIAPNSDKTFNTFNHQSGQEGKEKRNVIVESARIHHGHPVIGLSVRSDINFLLDILLMMCLYTYEVTFDIFRISSNN